MKERRHHSALEPHRMVWFRTTSYSAQGETCQCEGMRMPDRSACPVHGPSGAALYRDAWDATRPWVARPA